MSGFTKTQIVQSKTYRQYRDVLAVILSDNETYTHESVAQMLDKFMKMPVKEELNQKGV